MGSSNRNHLETALNGFVHIEKVKNKFTIKIRILEVWLKKLIFVVLCDWRQSYCDIRKGGWFALQFLMKNENLVMKIHFEDIFSEKNTWLRGFQEIYLTRQVTEPGAFHISPLCHKFRCIISKCLFSKENVVLITPRTEFYIRNTDFPFGILLFGLHLIRIQIQPDFQYTRVVIKIQCQWIMRRNCSTIIYERHILKCQQTGCYLSNAELYTCCMADANDDDDAATTI